MAADQLTFQGINRAVSDYAASGACEELINLRPTTAGLVPVKPFSVKMSGINYDKVYVHNAQGKTNYIGVSGEGDSLVGYLLDDSGQAIGNEIFRVAGGDSLPQITGYATSGNIAVFSFEDKEDGIYATRTVRWNGSAYETMEADVPDVEVSFASSLQYNSFSGEFYDDNTDKRKIADIINIGQNAVQEQNDDYCFGPVIVAIAFKTNDGKTFWTGSWHILNPLPQIKDYTARDYFVTPSWELASSFPDFFREHPEGGFVAATSNASQSDSYTPLIGLKYDMTVRMASGVWNADTSMIKSIEIYASRPKMYTDAAGRYGDTQQVPSGLYYTLLPQVPHNDMDLSSELLYLQRSIALSDLTEGSLTFTLQFGGNIQTTNTTLEVDAGMVTRYGKVLSYNSRFHYYDSIKKTGVGKPDFGAGGNQSVASWAAFIRYNDGLIDTIAYVGQVDVPTSDVLVIAPTLHIKEVIIYSYNLNMHMLRKYAMTESSRYNYSYNDSGPCLSQSYSSPTSEIRELLRIQGRGVQSSFYTEEPDAMNVSEQYNPFVFRVEHSYLAPGKILDVQPQMVAVSNVSYGDYPLNIFTTRGVYALLQGDRNILYGNMRAISNLVSEKNCVPTESGTFFIAAGGLWLIFGNHAVLISDALHLGPHRYIRTSAGHVAIAYDKYALNPYESAVSFEQFTKGAALAYNRYRDELIISNPGHPYSYVLSLKYRQWYKIAQSLSQDVVGSNIARQGDTIYDFSDEREKTTILVHLQSRPLSFAYQYSHIHRIVAMIRATLSSQVDLQALTVALYGSDDLQTWKLLSYANRHNTSFSQIRTAPAARSWRYYTITISGNVPEDTDFGPVLIDYEPVIRRIG